ncbi:ATP-binding protein [Azorhizobium doebereinerae]|uniref:ATP-binding protein n=1 Tax=Azorhizobium doebereinerae TaxID=281091 RepID=UPI000688B069|nr:winged helix-turn-helix domain-containing protein [Azorhizobium doebereinerae]
MNHRSTQDVFSEFGAADAAFRPALGDMARAPLGAGAGEAGAGEAVAGEAQVAFGDFLLCRATQRVSRNGQTVRLGSRARDILFALLETPGQVVPHQALMARVWPDTVVEEGALRVHVAALRKALDDGPDVRMIVTETGRGYRFAAPVTVRPGASGSPDPRPQPQGTLPTPLYKLIGRGDLVTGLVEQVLRHRLLTIAGPGGIGKTSVGLAVAHGFAARTGHPACFVDLAPVMNGARVAAAVARRLGITVAQEHALPALTAALAERPTLLLLDNCEHLVDAVADLAETLLRGAPAARLLLTSREPLRAEGEWVHRLSALAAPPPEESHAPGRAIAYPAVELFVERARAIQHHFVLTEANVAAVCDICIRLDGLPLALEFAAARLDVMDVATLAGRLDDRFSLLTKGKRTAVPRQQTLRAVLDWSYELLDGPSQAALRRLSVFRACFDLRAAMAVIAGPGPDGTGGRYRTAQLDEAEALDAIADLVAKSLLVVEARHGGSDYRMLETTRQYALRRLAETEEEADAKRRHARHYCVLFSEANAVWEGKASRDWIRARSRSIDDIRAAFAWAFSAEGDAAIRLQLLSTAAFVWFDLSLPSEFMPLAERALSRTSLADFEGTAEHVGLLTAYGHALWHVRGPGPEMSGAFASAQAMARGLGLASLERRALWGVWAHHLLSGDYPASLEAAEAYERLAPNGEDVAGYAAGRRMFAISRHFLGHHGECRQIVEGLMQAERTFARPNYANVAQVDARIAALAFRMRTLWLEGHVDEALELARGFATYGSVGHDLSACYCYAVGALPVALWSGDTNLASALLPGLLARARQRGLRYWELWGEGFAEALGQRAAPPDEADIMQLEMFATFGSQAALARLEAAGRLDAAAWTQPELLRRRALRRMDGDPAGAEADLTRALALAERQGARSWALRCATALAGLLRTQGRDAAALALLAPARSRLDGGRASADVAAADRLIAGLKGA